MSTLLDFAKCLTAGVDKAFALPSTGAALWLWSATAAEVAEGVWAGVECSFFVSTAYEPSLSSVSIVIIECPTAQMVSFSKLIFLTTPVAVDGILATSLSVNTSQRSSY